MSYTVFGYKTDKPVSTQDMKEYVQASLNELSTNTQNYVDSAIQAASSSSASSNATMTTYINEQDKLDRDYVDTKVNSATTTITAAYKQVIEAEIAAIVPAAAIDTSSFLYSSDVPISSQFPQFTGIAKQVVPSTLISHDSVKSSLSVNGSIIFRGPPRFIGEAAAPCFRTHTIAIDSGAFTGYSQNDLTIKAKNVKYENTGVIELGKNGAYLGTEIMNFIPLLYFPTDIPIVIPRVLYSRSTASSLAQTTLSKVYITDFPILSSNVYGSLTVPAIGLLPNFKTMSWRFDMTGILYSANTLSHTLNLGCSISQSRALTTGGPETKYLMDLHQEDSPDDVYTTTTGGKPRAFHLICDIRTPPASYDPEYRGGFRCMMIMQVAGNQPGNLKDSWTGSTSQNIYYDTDFKLNVSMSWGTAGNNKYIELDKCTLTQCNF